VTTVKAAFLAAAPTPLVSLRPVDTESTLILASRPIVDNFSVGDVKDVHIFSPSAEHNTFIVKSCPSLIYHSVDTILSS
jgi:hypothetical protein